MRIACIGGGPSGLFLAILMKRRRPDSEIVVFERNRLGDTFGFGVVFSDDTLANIAAADPESIEAIERRFRHWSEMEVRVAGRIPATTTGHGFSALSRVELLQILTARALELGVDVRFEHDVSDLDALRHEFDVVVAGDGVRSATRARLEAELQPSIVPQPAHYIWTGTEAPFDRFTFIFEHCPAGWVQAHVYPFDDTTSTFIIEMGDDTWANAGLDGITQFAPGVSDPQALAFCQTLFADHLHGYPLIGNNSKWLQFPRISARRWRVGNVVMLGDAVHTAHYSIGSGTKLALEDAIALADALCAHDEPAIAIEAYEAARRPIVESTQRAATTSEEWFQQVNRHIALPDDQFVFSLMTRSQRVTYENLLLRDPAWMARLKQWFWETRPIDQRAAESSVPPMFFPFRLRDLTLPNRVVVSPMAQYSAVDGMPSDWHLVHLGSRAVGGAGLVLTEMTCVSPQGRITPGCTGIWNDDQAAAWARIVDFVHEHTPAKIGLQIGHAGRKGSTALGWEGGEEVPLVDCAWPTISASAVAYTEAHPAPAEMTRAQMDEVISEFVEATERGAAAGFDLIELHAAHGYLLSAFLAPFTNRRIDEYGGSVEARMRFPVEVATAVRGAWPSERPMSVRISATDWLDGGFGVDEAVDLARALKAAGVDVIDVSTGQVDPSGVPQYGRLYQMPFSERIRNDVGIPTMAVGAIASIDDVNTALLAGRADLCLLARPHLVDPYWTLNAAIDQGIAAVAWPKPYLAGMTARRREQQAVASVARDLR